MTPEKSGVRAEMQRVEESRRGVPRSAPLHQRIAAMLRDGQPNSAIRKAVGTSDWTIKAVAKAEGIYRVGGGRVVTKEQYDASNAKRAEAKGQTPRVEAPLPESSLKSDILRVVAEVGPHEDVEDICRFLRGPGRPVGVHEATHCLISLAKQGLVKYTESKTGGVTRYRRIRATKQGYDALGYPPGVVEIGTPKANGAVKVGWDAGHAFGGSRPGDPTDYHNQPSVAPGGPVTRSRVPVAHVEFAAKGDAIVEAPEPTEAPALVPAEERNWTPLVVIFGEDGPGLHPFPAINDLINRKAKIEKAARALEAAGLEDMALEALSKIDDMTPLEAEIVRLVKEAGWVK